MTCTEAWLINRTARFLTRHRLGSLAGISSIKESSINADTGYLIHIRAHGIGYSGFRKNYS